MTPFTFHLQLTPHTTHSLKVIFQRTTTWCYHSTPIASRAIRINPNSRESHLGNFLKMLMPGCHQRFWSNWSGCGLSQWEECSVQPGLRALPTGPVSSATTPHLLHWTPRTAACSPSLSRPSSTLPYSLYIVNPSVWTRLPLHHRSGFSLNVTSPGGFPDLCEGRFPLGIVPLSCH